MKQMRAPLSTSDNLNDDQRITLLEYILMS